MRKVSLFIVAVLCSGCVSQLTCGVDGDESYVDLVNVKDGVTVRNYAELCGFAYEVKE